jgi:3-hydroxyisobutyrate dehydrogenase
MGNMGLPMAANLAKNGFEVKGFDMSDKQREKAKEHVSMTLSN